MQAIIEEMRRNFERGGLRPVETRRALLQKLKRVIKAHEADILAAEQADFNKNAFDVYATEIGVVYGEIDCAVRHVRRWARPKKARLSLANFPAKGRVYPEGYGVALIIAPWNYPFQLALCPLVGAIAAGNCAVVKPASATPATAAVIADIVRETFADDEVYCALGGRETVRVLDYKYDMIFFTGSPAAGRAVMRAAADTLTPVVLELGGKSPCIVDRDCDVPSAARRLAWGKYVNAGQTCVAPDYLYLHADIYDVFMAAFEEAVRAQYYVDGALSSDFTALVSEAKAADVAAKLSSCEILFGGGVCGRTVEPTAVRADENNVFMAEEIFAPVLPVIPFTDGAEVRRRILSRPRPLALYYFGRRPDPFVRGLSFGGGCVNDTVMHVAEHNLPFGGVGLSGMGRYHGKYSFDAFSHYKSVLYKGRMEVRLKYAPHTEKALRTVKRIIK